MSLLLQVRDDGVSTETTLLEDLLDCKEVVPLESNLEQVISVVYLENLHLTSSIDSKDGVLHEERDVNWLVDALEGSDCLTLRGEHVLDVGCGRVDESVVSLLIEAACFDLG